MDRHTRLHLAACPVWGLSSSGAYPPPCSCPRPWRIRHRPIHGDPFATAFPWVISRYIESTNSYDYWLRAKTQPFALSMVNALIRFSAVQAGR